MTFVRLNLTGRLFLLILLFVGCGKEYQLMATTQVPSGGSHQPTISRDQALQIARTDGEKVYRDLSGYQVNIQLEQDGWHVDYEPKDSHVQGGGPHYIIDPTSGAILRKRYEQ
jgi:hypothetical protein